MDRRVYGFDCDMIAKAYLRYNPSLNRSIRSLHALSTPAETVGLLV
jgi:hypothetical protein